MAAALGEDPRYVSGTVARRGGGIVIEPLAFAFEDRVIVPDLTEAGHTDPVHASTVGDNNVLNQVLDETAALLSEMAHRGMHHMPSTTLGRLERAAASLGRAGLPSIAADVQRVAAQLGPQPGPEVVEYWVNAYLRVTVARDLV